MTTTLFKSIPTGVSSRISNIWYCEDAYTLIVQFKSTNSRYLYEQVSLEMADAFQAEGEALDGSTGKLLYSLIEQPNRQAEEGHKPFPYRELNLEEYQ